MKNIRPLLSVAAACCVLALTINTYAAVVFEDDFTAPLPTTNSGLWQNGNRPVFADGGTQSLAWDGVSSAVAQVVEPTGFGGRTGMVSLNNVVSAAQLSDSNATVTAKVTFGPTSLTGTINERPQTRLTLTPKQSPSADFYGGGYNLFEGRVQFGWFDGAAQLNITINGGVGGTTQLFQSYLNVTPGAGDSFSYTISPTQLLDVTYYSKASDTTHNLLSSPTNLVFIADMATDFTNGARLGIVHWQGLPGGTSSSSWDSVQVEVSPVPEPGSLGLIMFGAFAMLYRNR